MGEPLVGCAPLGVLAGLVAPDQVSLLGGAELGWLALQSAFCFGDLHALPRSDLDEVRLELGDHGRHVEQQPFDRVVRVVQRPADVEFHFGGRELLDDVAGLGQGSTVLSPCRQWALQWHSNTLSDCEHGGATTSDAPR